jgi:FkbM family methyltransferase
MKEIRGIWFPDVDTHFAPQIAASPMVDGRGTYQYRKYQEALKHVEARRHAVDVGAHVGLWSRVMLIDFNHVTAFEPLPAHLECFEANIGDDPMMTLHRCAVSDVDGSLSIQMPADNTGNAHVGKDGHEVEAKPLDAFDLSEVDLLKIDVEGWEHRVVIGAEETIRRERPVVVVEQKPGHAERYGVGQWDAVKLLQSFGMRQVAVISGDHVMVW